MSKQEIYTDLEHKKVFGEYNQQKVVSYANFVILAEKYAKICEIVNETSNNEELGKLIRKFVNKSR